MSNARWRTLGLAWLVEGGLLVVAYGLGWWASIDPLDMTPSFSGSLWGLGSALPLLLLFMLSLRTRQGGLARLVRTVEHAVRQLFAHSKLPDIAVVSLLAGLAEEALFRGVIMVGIAREGGWLLGIAVSSVLFGLAHAMTRVYALTAGLAGVYFGVLLWASGNLWVPLVAHAAYDFVAIAYLLRRRS